MAVVLHRVASFAIPPICDNCLVPEQFPEVRAILFSLKNGIPVDDLNRAVTFIRTSSWMSYTDNNCYNTERNKSKIIDLWCFHGDILLSVVPVVPARRVALDVMYILHFVIYNLLLGCYK